MIRSLKDLLVVELDRLILHESYDAKRLARLRRRVEAEKFQQNPVIVSAFEDDYLVLDGVHRVRGMAEIGCRFILVQVVELPDKAEGWAHLLRGVTPQKLETLENIETPSGTGSHLADVEYADGGHALVESGDRSLAGQVAALWGLQSLYPEEEVVRRVEGGTRVNLEAGEALIHYRDFTPQELVEVVRAGSILPAGITHFRVRERVLGIRFPLEKLRGGNLDGRNKELESLVAERWEQNRVRYYDEPIVLFE